MKKLIVLAAFALIAVTGFSQVTATASGAGKSEVAAPAFDTQNFDFGKVKQGVPVTHEFVFTNKSSVPMIITTVTASCGCTTPGWTKEPIPPNGQGFVKATYNAAAVGTFDKSVTVMANVENGVVMLRIHGEVVAAQQ
jgi:hypothetical protein